MTYYDANGWSSDFRFWTKVKIAKQCWEWTASTYKKGYGSFWLNGRNVRAHRFSYEMLIGPIPAGMKVLHKCDNPKCVRPDHLFLGTINDNNKDKARKNRANNQYRGITHCKRGHEFTAANVKDNGKGGRRCRECYNASRRKQ